MEPKTFKQQIEEACAEMVIRNNFNLFVTLPFNIKALSRRHLSDEKKLKALSKFFNNLDTLVYGKAKRLRGTRLPRLVGIHYGYSGENLHAHTYFIEQTISNKNGQQQLSEIIKELWNKTESFCHSAHTHKFYNDKQASDLLKAIQKKPLSKVAKMAWKIGIQAQQHRTSYLVHEVRNKDTDCLSTKLSTVM